MGSRAEEYLWDHMNGEAYGIIPEHPSGKEYWALPEADDRTYQICVKKEDTEDNGSRIHVKVGANVLESQRS